MSAGKVDLLRIGVSAALRNCADYLRDEQGLTEAAEQIEAIDEAVAELIKASREYRDATDYHVRNCVYCHNHVMRLDAALANIGGSA